MNYEIDDIMNDTLSCTFVTDAMELNRINKKKLDFHLFTK